jgi:hypothetical protein
MFALRILKVHICTITKRGVLCCLLNMIEFMSKVDPKQDDGPLGNVNILSLGL